MGRTFVPLVMLAASTAGALRAQVEKQRRFVPMPTRELTFTVTDNGLTGPDSSVSGMVVLKLVNRGRTMHELQMIGVSDAEHTARQALEETRRTGRYPPWLLPAGGIGPVEPGQTVTMILRLQAGQYLLVDDFKTSDGTSFAQRGVIKALVVSGTVERIQMSVVADAAISVGNVTLAFGTILRNGSNYEILEGRARELRLRPGERVIEINSGAVGHQIVLIKADSPEAMRQFARWEEDGSGKPPDGILGGLPTTIQNLRVYLKVRLEHGSYFVFCPAVHARRTGLRGFQTGEFTQFTVR